MADRIFVSNLCLHGTHGVFPEERRVGQKFFLDIECITDFEACSLADSYKHAVCYADICDVATQVSASGPFKLIESLAERIAAQLLERFRSVSQVRVQVRKPSAPVSAIVDHVGVEVVRTRRSRIGFSLGSNMGDKASAIRTAVAFLQAEDGIEIEAVSSLYRSPPWGRTDQEWFVNACAVGWTTASPRAVLKACKRIELQLGRVPGERWGPRAIDIDLLFVDDLAIASPELALPHPEMFNRAFVLIPLAELAPGHDVQGRSIAAEAKRFPPGPDTAEKIV